MHIRHEFEPGIYCFLAIITTQLTLLCAIAVVHL